MNYFSYIQKALISVCIITGMLSCSKFVEVDPPLTQIDAASVFTNDQTATSAIVGLYSQMVNGGKAFFNGYISLYPDLSSDQLTTTNSAANDAVFVTNSIPIDNSTVGGFWTQGYKFIYHANAILEGLTGASGVTPSVKARIIGEAKFVRGLTFFYLTNLFGEIPLELTTDYKINAVLKRSSVAEVYKQIILDLTEAQQLLDVAYTTTASFPTDRVRPNKWAATAMLARVYLYEKDYVNAEYNASLVIRSKMYELGSLSNAFLKASTEAIFQLMPVSTTFNTAEGNIFLPSSTTSQPAYALTSDLLNSFENGDLRKVYWVSNNVVNGKTYYYPYKYKVRTSSGAYAEYNMVLRYAEMYLIRSEARAQQNATLDSAINDLNVIRERAGLGKLAYTLTKAQLLLAVEQERRVELFAEWGHRWLDLKRTDRADLVLKPIKGSNWQSTDVLYPIPMIEIRYNSNLTQNPGYF